jgi:hypothetical protein
VVVGGPGWRATAHWHPWWNYCDLRGLLVGSILQSLATYEDIPGELQHECYMMIWIEEGVSKWYGSVSQMMSHTILNLVAPSQLAPSRFESFRT